MFIPRTLRTFGELVAFLADAQVPHRADPATQTIVAGPVTLHWELDHPFLHVTIPLLTVPPERGVAVALAVLQRNHEAKFPILDYDPTANTVALRMTTPLLVDGIRVDLVQALLSGIDLRAAELRADLARLVA